MYHDVTIPDQDSELRQVLDILLAIAREEYDTVWLVLGEQSILDLTRRENTALPSCFTTYSVLRSA